jgi:SOS-response transcriptional repressor LexA
MSQNSDLAERIYSFIEVYIEEHQYAPTVREIARSCSISLGTVVYHLEELQKEGRLRRSRYKARSIRLLNTPQRLNELSEKIYQYIASSFQSEGLSPSQEEIAVACNLSKTAVQSHLKILEEQGRIELGKGHRQVRLLK